ncbi:DUF6193 family natural product biosynthesis protein [Kitasatospora sp. NPDC056446]|uniref:DUF6193 family natural product biosynthesis protein n=1 Tax=Kitasatospora sp. NPDC056446 TaxID=3345819 RepID=UPI0036CC5E30
MDNELQQSWDWQIEGARSFDESVDNDHTWPPPNLSVLTAAVHATTLRRLHPFTSHASLHLSSSARCWEPGARTAPACIAMGPSGDYFVWSGEMGTNEQVLVLETPDPAAAAARFEELLAGWE